MSARVVDGYTDLPENSLEAQVEIRASCSKVFDFFTDYRNVTRLIRYVTRISPLDSEKTRCLGARFLAHLSYRFVGIDFLFEVVELKHEARYVLELVKPGVDVACALDFRTVPGGTLVELVAAYTLPKLPSPLRRLVPDRELRLGVMRLLNDVKSILDEPNWAQPINASLLK